MHNVTVHSKKLWFPSPNKFGFRAQNYICMWTIGTNTQKICKYLNILLSDRKQNFVKKLYYGSHPSFFPAAIGREAEYTLDGLRVWVHHMLTRRQTRQTAMHAHNHPIDQFRYSN